MSSSAECMACLEPVVCGFIVGYRDQLSCISGRHCCLWCHITSADLKKPLSVRGKCSERSLATLQQDHNNFMANGGDIAKAKLFNNAIAPIMLDIPLDKVYKNT